LEQQGYPKQQIEWLQQMIAGQPGSQTTSQTGTFAKGGGNAAMGALGGALSGAAAGSVVPVYGTAIGAVAGGILGGLSSR
jgi:phage tail tape-measure protein